MKFKMAATPGLSLTLDPMGKMFQNASFLKPLGQLKPNCPGMIIGRSSTKFMFFMSIGNPRWAPLQDILLTQDYMGKYRNILLLNPNYTWMFFGWSSTKQFFFRSSLIFNIAARVNNVL
jgi:hypothetical protein